MEIDPHIILVIDDQIGQQKSDRADFLEAVGYYQSAGSKKQTNDYPYEFEFHTGQDEAGRNSVEAVKETVLRCWPDANGKRWALILLDVRFGEDEKFGFTLLRALREDSRFGKDLPIVMLTSEDEAKRARAGELKANGFLPKADAVGNALWSRNELEQKVLKFGLITDDRDDDLIAATHTTRLVGRSLALLKTLREARFYALDPIGCLILSGETGSGKTELAGYIHCYTSRKNGPYIHWFADPVNKDVMKPELFGKWKGTFTDGKTSEPGKLELAHGGTFFLDEVANLPVDLQKVFLQFREEDENGLRILARIGQFPFDDDKAQAEAMRSVPREVELLPDRRIRVNVLLLTGTNKNLEDPKIRESLQFLDELHNSLGTPLRCPNLNQRKEDIPILFEAMVRRVLARPGKPLRKCTIDSDVYELLQQRDWSHRGNVRDLKRIAQYAAQKLGDFPVIRRGNLPGDVVEETQKPKSPVDIGKEIEMHGISDAGESAPAAMQSKPVATEECSTHGSLTRVELEHLRHRAFLLEEAAEAERDKTPAGVKTKYLPTKTISRLMGEKVTTTNAKRIIKDILGTILDTPDYLVAAYGKKELESVREWVKSQPVLVALYRYAIGEITADEIK